MMSDTTTEPNESKQTDPDPPASATALLTKLKHILENVTSQEKQLNIKTSKIETWYKMHKSALLNTAKVKKKLTEFEPINESTDNQEIKDQKTEHKHAINLALDNLSSELSVLHESEAQYRSIECIELLKKQTAAVHQLKNKNSILLTHNKSLLEQNANYDKKIKLLSQQHDVLMESTKKDLFDRHKDYVENLQYQHEAQLKSANVLRNNQLNYELTKLRKEKEAETGRKLNELTAKLNTQFNGEREDFHKERDLLKQKTSTLEEDTHQKDELLAKYVELDKEHQQLSVSWSEHKKKLQTEVEEMKQTEMKTAEKLLELQHENAKLQQHAVKHSLSSIKHAEKIEKLNLEILELKTLKKTYKKQLSEIHQQYELLSSQYKHVKQEKSTLIKEVKRLRQNIVEKDEKKSEILTKMSQKEEEHKQIVNELNSKHSNVIQRFKQLIYSLADCNSHIENFSDTINNFSYKGLRECYESEYDARSKSTELLNDTLIGKINDEIIKIHSEINVNKIKDELKAIETNEVKLKSLFDESDIQISYIRMAVLKLLMEYIESIKKCNDVYITHNKPIATINGEEMKNGDHDGMYNYVSSGVSAVATLVNPFSWNKNEMDEIDIIQVKQKKNVVIHDPVTVTQHAEEETAAKQDEIEEEEEETHHDIDSISQHYLAKSEFLSVTDSGSVDNDAIQID